MKLVMVQSDILRAERYATASCTGAPIEIEIIQADGMTCTLTTSQYYTKGMCSGYTTRADMNFWAYARNGCTGSADFVHTFTFNQCLPAPESQGIRYSCVQVITKTTDASNANLPGHFFLY